MKKNRELQDMHNKKFKFIAFVYIPLLFIIALILGSWIAKILGFKIEPTGVLFVIGVLVIVYFLTIKSFFEKLRKKNVENHSGSDE